MSSGTSGRVGAIILAAGASSRMGRSKAILEAGPGETFLARWLRVLKGGGILDYRVVLGPERSRPSAL